MEMKPSDKIYTKILDTGNLGIPEVKPVRVIRGKRSSN